MENNYQLSRIHNYVHGLMDPQEMYQIEREALEDPLLQDAIDGYRLQNGVDTSKLSLLQQRLSARIEQQVYAKNKRFYNWQRLAVGMTAGVLFVTVSTLMLMRYFAVKPNQELLEVQIMQDQVFDVVLHLAASNDATPKGGWSSFKSTLEQKLSVYTQQEIQVSFIINSEGQAQDLQIITENDILKAEISDAIEKHNSWSGEKASFTLQLDELKIK